MKKLLRICCLLLILALCTACGDTSKEPAGPTKPDNPSTPIDQPSDNPSAPVDQPSDNPSTPVDQPSDNPPAQSHYSIAGKTFFKTYDNYGNEEHSNICFKEDGTFVYRDQFFDGMNIMTGTWTLKGEEITLNVEKTGLGTYTKVMMRVAYDDVIILEDLTVGSNAGDVFSATSDLSDYIKNEKGFRFGEYENMDDEWKLVIKKDGSVEIHEIEGFGAELHEGTWTFDGNKFVLSFSDPTFTYPGGDKVENLWLFIKSYNTVALVEDLENSWDEAIYMYSEDLAAHKKDKPGDALSFGTFEDRDGYSFMILSEDGSFEFSECTKFGAMFYAGTWVREGDTLKCTAKETDTGIDYLEFVIKNGKNLVLMTELPDIPILLNEHQFLLMD